MPMVFSIVGEVRRISFGENEWILWLGKPLSMSRMMELFWRQQLATLEKVEFEDYLIDCGLRIGHFFLSAVFLNG
ncbi:hypothetical protein L208DRAFT_1388517 [Tricholoma matsutake]|nr:hypothetical protein L208DRAFT_1388517 [Tricholoma matsutake 945]